MTTFLQAYRNLKDLDDIPTARKVLGIGSMSIQDSNDINITGGSIIASHIGLDNGNATPGAYLISIDEKGTMDWHVPIVADWVSKNQSEIAISSFFNDAVFVSNHSLCNVAFTGMYEDLDGKPQNLSDLENDLSFLRVDCNLSDLQDLDEAKRNLGLGPLAFQDDYYVTVSNLSILSEFRFTPLNPITNPNEGMFLMLGESNLSKWANLPIATESTYGMLKLTNNYKSSAMDRAPSAYAVSNAYSSLYNMIAKVEENEYMQDLIDYFQVLTKQNNLSEFLTHNEIDQVRTNLGIGTFATQNVDNVIVDNISIVGSISFSQGAFSNAFLTTDINGNVYWSSLPNASYSEPGLVNINDDYSFNPLNNFTVPSSKAISNLYVDIQNHINVLSNSIPRTINELADSGDYLLLSDGLKGIDANFARENLGLHPVARSGMYIDLIGRPTKLGDFINEPKYLLASENLADVANITETRRNLNLGTISLQDSNNVNITNGIGNFNNLSVSDLFTFTDSTNTNDIQGTFLKCIDNVGTARWEHLPEATTEIFGVVKLSHDFTYSNTDKAASATSVFKAYNMLLGRIEGLEYRLNQLLSF